MVHAVRLHAVGGPEVLKWETVEVGEPNHPWRSLSGIFKDDPTYDDLLAEIEAYRREIEVTEQDSADLSP